MKKQNKGIKSKIISNTVTGLLILSICACLFVFVQVFSKGYVSLAGYSFFRVTTGSMEPEIPIGAIILTHKVDIRDVEIDDIVSFHSKEQYMLGRIITHRVVDKEEGADGSVRLTTRGDANSAADVYFVDSDNLIGMLVWNSKGDNLMANIIAFLSGRIGFFTCIALPAILVAVLIFKKSMNTMLKEIKTLKAEISMSDKEEPNDLKTVTTAENKEESRLSLEEFDDMYKRIRAELIKELNTENDREQKEK